MITKADDFTLPVLDHGFVRLRNLAGPTRRASNPCPGGIETAVFLRAFDADDTDPANAARMSFDGQDQDRDYEVEMKLNRYLAMNKHMTPFEMIEVWLEMKLPIFVARQFVRHRTVSLNEISGRYVQLPAEWYIPTQENVLLQTVTKKQGGLSIDLMNQDHLDKATWFTSALRIDCERSYHFYEQAIANGIAMEQARLFLHVNHYTHWLWKQDLRNMFGFLLLRDHGHAQKEAQAYAKVVTQLLDPHIPGLMQLYKDIIRGEKL